MRYTSSMFVAIILSLLTFLGMSLLIANPKYKKSTNLEMVDFSKIADVKQATVKPIKKTQPPKKAKAKQPPVAPSLDLTDTPGRSDIEMPKNNYRKNDFTVSELTNPTIVNPLGGPYGKGDSGLTHLLAIEPIYPANELRNKTEGWVKVEITVNEFGQVSHAEVIDSHPKRVFNRATLKAIYKSKFKPLVVNGKAMSQTAIQIIEFKISN